MNKVSAVALVIAFIVQFAAGAPAVKSVGVAKDGADSTERVRRSLSDGPAVVRDLSRSDGGRLFSGQISAPRGRYRLHVPVAVRPLGSVESASLFVKIRAGAEEKSFNILAFATPDGFVDLTVPFTTTGAAVPVEVTWGYEGSGAAVARSKAAGTPKAPAVGDLNDGPHDKDLDALELDPDAPQPIESARAIARCVMLREIPAEPLSPVFFQSATTDKITYKRGEQGQITLDLINTGPASESVVLKVEIASALDRTTPVKNEVLTIPAGGRVTWKGTFTTDSLSWGCALQATASVPGRPAEKRSAIFSVPERFWDVAIMASCPAQMTREFASMDNARRAAAKLKEEGYTGFEAYFWAPCDFLDYTPTTDRFYSGQTAYVQSVAGTRNLLAACHELGIVGTFYANLWGGSGEPAFEMMRRHPDWFGSANFHSGSLDDAALMTAGVIRGPGHKFWSYNQLNDKADMGLFDYHADQILGTKKMFGWDGIRYDSYYSAPWTIKAMTHIRERIAKQAPDFLFGFNAFADAEYKVGAMDSISNGMIMAEGLRIGPGTKIGDFVLSLNSWRDLAWPYGSTIGPIYGFTSGDDKKAAPPTSLDHVLMTSALLATGSHPYYNPIENTLGKHPDFALRYAEFLYNTRMRIPLDPDGLVQWAKGIDPLAWRPLLRTLSMGQNKHRLVLHVINAPTGYALSSPDMKTLPPLINASITFKLPPDAKVRGAWMLQAVPQASHEALAVSVAGNEATVTLPQVRFYAAVVLEFESGTPIAEKIDAKSARSQNPAQETAPKK